MVSTSVITLTIIVTSMATLIVSNQAMNEEIMADEPVVDPSTFVAEMMDQLDVEFPNMEPQQRTNFASLFNLSAALANAPNNTAAFTKIPLITLLFGSGGFGR